VTLPTGSPVIDATWLVVRTEQTSGPPAAAAPEAAGAAAAAGGLAGPAEPAGPPELAADGLGGGAGLPLHAASAAVASATALMVRAARRGAAGSAA
jgi:hypothetical protein